MGLGFMQSPILQKFHLWNAQFDERVPIIGRAARRNFNDKVALLKEIAGNFDKDTQKSFKKSERTGGDGAAARYAENVQRSGNGAGADTYQKIQVLSATDNDQARTSKAEYIKWQKGVNRALFEIVFANMDYEISLLNSKGEINNRVGKLCNLFGIKCGFKVPQDIGRTITKDELLDLLVERINVFQGMEHRAVREIVIGNEVFPGAFTAAKMGVSEETKVKTSGILNIEKSRYQVCFRFLGILARKARDNRGLLGKISKADVKAKIAKLAATPDISAYMARILQGEDIAKILNEINGLHLNGQKDRFLLDLAENVLDREPARLIEFAGGLDGSARNVLAGLKKYKPNSHEVMLLEKRIYPTTLLGGINIHQANEDPALLKKELETNERMRISEELRPLLVQEYGEKLGNEIFKDMQGLDTEKFNEIGTKLQTGIKKMSNREFAKLIGEPVGKATEIKAKLDKYIVKGGGVSFTQFAGGMISMVGISALLNYIWPDMNPSLNFSITILGSRYVNSGVIRSYMLLKSQGIKGGLQSLKTLKEGMTALKALRTIPKVGYDLVETTRGFGYGKLTASGWRVLMDVLGVKNEKLRNWGEFAAFMAPDIAVGCNKIILKRLGVKVFSKLAAELGSKAIGKVGSKAIPFVGWAAFGSELTLGGAEAAILDPYMRSVIARAKEEWKEAVKTNGAAKYGLVVSDALVSPFMDAMVPGKYIDQVMQDDEKMENTVFEELGRGLFGTALAIDPYLLGNEKGLNPRPAADQFTPDLKKNFKEFLIKWIKAQGVENFRYIQYIVKNRHEKDGSFGEGYKAFASLKADEKNPDNIEVSDELINFMFKKTTFDNVSVGTQLTKARMNKDKLDPLAK